MKKIIFATLPVFVLGIALAPNMYAWGCEGHQVVAYIAERELNPSALSAANALLQDFPIDIHRNCSASPGTTPLSDAATWADDVRFARPNTGAWHFIDVPLDNAGRNPNAFCNDACVLSAIDAQSAALRDASGDPLKRTEALRFIIHFVGDVHQPLHASTNADRGGNCVPVFFDRKPHLSKGSYSPELHGIWDTQMVAELADRSSVDDAESLAQLLDSEITARERSDWANSVPMDWAVESSRFASSAAYAGLTQATGEAVAAADIANSEEVIEVNGKPQTKCGLTAEKRIFAMRITPDSDYRDNAEAVIELRLKQAGVRLAALLNQVWPDDSAPAHHAVHAAHHK